MAEREMDEYGYRPPRPKPVPPLMPKYKKRAIPEDDYLEMPKT